MPANTLFLRLEGPLQSWGERAHWSIRDTAPEPTKSGIVGLLGCALGMSSDDDLRNLSSSIKIGIRCDRPGTILRDYHTVVGGVMSAEGKIKINAGTKEPETVVSERFYLADASFLVAIRAEPSLISRISTAIQEPTWPYFLGRKSCPPAMPVYAGEGDFASLETALKAIPVQLRKPEEVHEVSLHVIVECNPSDENAIPRKDEINSHARRTFLPRFTRDMLLTVPVQQEAK